MNTTTETIFDQISIRIIKQQELIIGPIAWDEAKKVQGFRVDKATERVDFDGDAKEILNRLVAQYARLFGKVSTEVCRESVQDLLAELPPDELPSSLQ